MTISDFVRISRANLPFLIACTILGAVLGYGYTLTLPKLYASDAAGYVVGGTSQTTGDAVVGQSLASQKAESYIGLVNSRSVGDRIAKDLKLAEPGASIAGKLSAAVDPGSVLLRVTATSTDPQEAQKLANAGIKALSEQANFIESGGNPNAASPVVKIIPLENAMLPGAPFSPKTSKYVAPAAAAGLALGYIIVFLRRVLDRRVRHSAEVETALETSVLGVIPKVSELSGKRRGGGQPLGSAAESMRQLRTNLRFVDVDKRPRAIVVTSPNPGEGKSTVAANLARVLAAAGQPTILVDADLRRPMVATVFDVDGSVGLTQALTGDVQALDVIQPTETKNLSILPAGRIPPNPAELLGSHRMKNLVTELSGSYMVILDAPPLLPVTDAGLLTAECDGCLLVLKVGATYKEQAAMAKKALNQVGGRLLGVVMNQAPRKSMGSVVYGYGYGNYDNTYYGSEYYSSDVDTSDPDGIGDARERVSRRQFKKSRGRSKGSKAQNTQSVD